MENPDARKRDLSMWYACPANGAVNQPKNELIVVKQMSDSCFLNTYRCAQIKGIQLPRQDFSTGHLPGSQPHPTLQMVDPTQPAMVYDKHSIKSDHKNSNVQKQVKQTSTRRRVSVALIKSKELPPCMYRQLHAVSLRNRNLVICRRDLNMRYPLPLVFVTEEWSADTLEVFKNIRWTFDWI